MDDSVFIHPTAVVETDDIGAGTVIWAFAHVTKGVSIGENCMIADHTFIEPNVRLDDGVTMKQLSSISEGTHVEEGVFIGPFVGNTNDVAPRSRRLSGFPEIAARYEKTENWLLESHFCRGASIGAGVLLAPGVTVGEFAMIGLGSMVLRDVPAHRMMFGNPARALGWVCYCGFKLKQEAEGEPYVCVEGCQRRFELSDENLLVPLPGSEELSSGA